MSILVIIFWVIVALIAYAFREELMAAAAFVGIFMGVGALLFWWWFDNPSLGAQVGFGFAVFIGLRIVSEHFRGEYATIFDYAYRFISIPFWLLNRIQLILTGPWRYVFKYISVGDSSRNVLRPLFYFLQILLYIITTPLRLLNAIIYNIFVYGLTELYDLICEVFLPNNYDEGRGSFFGWILWFPVRLIRYPIFHGSLVLIEGIIWTVIDIFIPTITMYHGTNLAAAQAIVGCSNRNKSLWANWLAGTFKASNSDNGWGGLGVYFAPSRQVAGAYSIRAGGEPVLIACRVSFGKILNYALAPLYVEANVGGRREHAPLNRYAEENDYVTAEWWNGSYWEYCMFDWQYRYNYPWRIRPIFVFNLRTGFAQHIDGGFRHWLFSKVVIDDIMKSTKFAAIVIAAVVIAAWAILWLFSNYSKWESYIPDWPEKTIVQQTFVSEPIAENPVTEAPVTNESYEEHYVEEAVTEEPEDDDYDVEEIDVGPSTVEEITDTRPANNNPPKDPPAPPPSKGTGFKLEKVDHIPNETPPPRTKTGFRLERINPNQQTNNNNTVDPYYY